MEERVKPTWFDNAKLWRAPVCKADKVDGFEHVETARNQKQVAPVGYPEIPWSLYGSVLTLVLMRGEGGLILSSFFRIIFTAKTRQGHP